MRLVPLNTDLYVGYNVGVILILISVILALLSFVCTYVVCTFAYNQLPEI